MRYLDPIQGTRTLLLTYQKDQWFIMNQGSALASIVAIPLASSTQWEVFGSSGSDVTMLAQSSTTSVQVLFKTALSSNRNLTLAKRATRGGVATTSDAAQNFTMTLDTENGSNAYALQAASIIVWINNTGGIVQWQNNTPANVNFIGGGYRFPRAETEGYGKVLGSSVSGLLNQFSINSIADAWGDSP